MDGIFSAFLAAITWLNSLNAGQAAFLAAVSAILMNSFDAACQEAPWALRPVLATLTMASSVGVILFSLAGMYQLFIFLGTL